MNVSNYLGLLQVIFNSNQVVFWTPKSKIATIWVFMENLFYCSLKFIEIILKIKYYGTTSKTKIAN